MAILLMQAIALTRVFYLFNKFCSQSDHRIQQVFDFIRRNPKVSAYR